VSQVSGGRRIVREMSVDVNLSRPIQNVEQEKALSETTPRSKVARCRLSQASDRPGWMRKGNEEEPRHEVKPWVSAEVGHLRAQPVGLALSPLLLRVDDGDEPRRQPLASKFEKLVQDESF
jgi:hypothetical protein